jgi:hypothetical protein
MALFFMLLGVWKDLSNIMVFKGDLYMYFVMDEGFVDFWATKHPTMSRWKKTSRIML